MNRHYALPIRTLMLIGSKHNHSSMNDFGWSIHISVFCNMDVEWSKGLLNYNIQTHGKVNNDLFIFQSLYLMSLIGEQQCQGYTWLCFAQTILEQLAK